MASRTVPIPDRMPLMGSMDAAQSWLNLKMAEAQRDRGLMSGRELSKVEIALQPQARKARTIYNPFTGEIRKEFI